jgi:hypothetical protein
MINCILPSLLAAIRTMILSMIATRLCKAGVVLRPLKRCHGNLRWILAFAVSGLLAGCGVPPTLTASATYTENVQNNYFDLTLRFANYNEAEFMSRSLERKIVSRGDNENSKLLQIVTESGGRCDTSSVTYRCVIHRNYVSNNCARGKCSRYKEHWKLTIRWNSVTPNFKPEIEGAISKPVFVDQNY